MRPLLLLSLLAASMAGVAGVAAHETDAGLSLSFAATSERCQTHLAPHDLNDVLPELCEIAHEGTVLVEPAQTCTIFHCKLRYTITGVVTVDGVDIETASLRSAFLVLGRGSAELCARSGQDLPFACAFEVTAWVETLRGWCNDLAVHSDASFDDAPYPILAISGTARSRMAVDVDANGVPSDLREGECPGPCADGHCDADARAAAPR